MRISSNQVVSAISIGLVIGCALIFVISQIIWISAQNVLVYSRDYDSHLVGYSVIYYVKANPSLIWQFYKDSHPTFTHWPPFGYLIGYIFTLAFGLNVKALYITGLFWWCALFTVALLIAKEVSKSYIGGALACALFALNPNIVMMSYSINLELPLAVMVGLASCLVLKSEGFSNRRLAILAGIFCGIAFITKPSALIYLSPLCIGALAQRNGFFKSRLKNLILATLGGVIVALTFYAPLLPLLFQDASNFISYKHFAFGARRFSSLLAELTSPFERIFYAVSIFFLIFQKDRLGFPLCLWFFGSFFMLMFTARHYQTLLFPTYLGLCLIGIRALLQPNLNPKYKSFSCLIAFILTSVFTANLLLEMFETKAFRNPNKMHAIFRTLKGFDGSYRFFPSLQDFLEQGTIFTEERNAVRVILQKRYADIPTNRFALITLHISDMALYERFVWTALGLDRPQLLSWLKFTAQKRAYAVQDQSKFIEHLNDVDLIIWMGKQCPDKVGLFKETNYPSKTLSFLTRSSLALSENERKNAEANLKLIKDCTTKEGEYTFWLDDKICFLKPNSACFRDAIK